MKTIKTIYKFPPDGTYGVKIPENILRITISCDGSNAIISTSKKLTLLYFRKLFNKFKPKNMLKQEYCDLYKNMGPIEMHPFFDEKEYLAGAYESNIIVFKVSKNSLNLNDAKKLTNQHYDNIKFIAWQYKQHGMLVSSSSDKVINIYDILRPSKVPFSKIVDDDVVKSLKFSNVHNSYLAAGYDKKLKIWDISRTTLHPIFSKTIFDDNKAVDILDWHSTQSNLLCGSRSGMILKVFNLKDQLDFLFEIKVKDIDNEHSSDQKLLSAYFLPGNGLVAVCEKKAYIFHTGCGGYEATIDQIVEFQCLITNFKIMTNDLNNNYFVYTDKENNFIVRQFTFDESLIYQKSFLDKDRGLGSSKKMLILKELENIKNLYPSSVAVDFKSDRNACTVKLMKDLTLIRIKVTFRENYPKILPVVEFENKNESFTVDKSLISKIIAEISKWEKETKYDRTGTGTCTIDNSYSPMEILVDDLLTVMNNHRMPYESLEEGHAPPMSAVSKMFSKFQGKGKEEHPYPPILPYVKTCSFTWNPNGRIVIFQYNKVDFKQLKPCDKMISNYSNLEDWVKFCMAEDECNMFSKSDNKLLQDELSPTIVTEKLKDLVNWKFTFDMDNQMLIKSLNREEILPNVFSTASDMQTNDGHCEECTDTLCKEHSMDILTDDGAVLRRHIYSNEVANENCEMSYPKDGCSPLANVGIEHSKSMRPIRVKRNKSKKKLLQLDIDPPLSHNDFNIINKLKIKILSHEHFFASIIFLLEAIKTQEIIVLVDILNLINFNINSIVDPQNSSDLLINFSKESIVTTLKSLERNKKYEFLYISILLITSRIFSEFMKHMNEIPQGLGLSTKALQSPTVVLFKNNFNRSNLNPHRHQSSNLVTKEKKALLTSILTHNGSILDQSTNELNISGGKYNHQSGIARSNSFDEDSEEDIDAIKLVYDNAPLDKEQSMLNVNNYHTNLLGGNEIYPTEKDASSKKDLIEIFGEGIISTLLDYLYSFSNELYRKSRMVERAELIKFLYIISSKLNIDTKLTYIIENLYVNIHPNAAKNKRLASSGTMDNTTQSPVFTENSLYAKFLEKVEKNKMGKKFFKTKMTSDENTKCFYCGERLKVGTFSLVSGSYIGHYHHMTSGNVKRLAVKNLKNVSLMLNN